MKRSLLVLPFLALLGLGAAFGTAGIEDDKFRQLEEILPTPNTYRTASGAPGHEYWQQRADYSIEVELDDGSGAVDAILEVEISDVIFADGFESVDTSAWSVTVG